MMRPVLPTGANDPHRQLVARRRFAVLGTTPQ